VDLGAGKGRALLLASLSPFRRIVGVEFSPELAAVAARNIDRFHSPAQRCRALTVECADATTYAYPDEPLLVYVYNPFGEDLMDQVFTNLDASCTRSPRRVLLVVANRTFPTELLTAHRFHPVDDSGTRFEWRPGSA
jgi:hypothetical protein